MTLADTIKNDLLTIEADLGNQVFTWDGEDYICIPSTDERLVESDSVRGNFIVQRVLNLTVRTNLFSDSLFPSAQDTVKYKSAIYRIVNVKQDPTGALLKLICIGTMK